MVFWLLTSFHHYVLLCLSAFSRGSCDGGWFIDVDANFIGFSKQRRFCRSAMTILGFGCVSADVLSSFSFGWGVVVVISSRLGTFPLSRG